MEASDGTCKAALGMRDSNTELYTCDMGHCTKADG